MRKPICFSLIFIFLLFLVSCNSCNRKSGSVLVQDASSKENLDSVYSNTAIGRMIKAHIRTAMGNGIDAEALYQKSLDSLRVTAGASEELYATYKRAPEKEYFLRTMLVESLKELHAPSALQHLSDIANDKIPANLYPGEGEMNTRQDEIVIRVTAVEGIAKLAADSLMEAEKVLTALIKNEDLTIRQMAVKGYLHSAFGNAQEKIEVLRRQLPKEEQWYITLDTTNIRQVKHPEMPAQFKLDSSHSSTAPKIK